jgi:hypothetical protein
MLSGGLLLERGRPAEAGVDRAVPYLRQKLE